MSPPLSDHEEGHRPTLILIAGYARAGKDTLASGILEWCKRGAAQVNFADPLKEAGNAYLEYLHLPGDFFNEQFKIENREFLIAAGRLARSIDKDVFAKNLVNYLPFIGPDENGDEHDIVVCSDWRYTNEWLVAADTLLEHNWLLRTIYVETAGVGPANEEEAYSILDLRMNVTFDQEFYFKPNARQEIMAEGRRLAQTWQL